MNGKTMTDEVKKRKYTKGLSKGIPDIYTGLFKKKVNRIYDTKIRHACYEYLKMNVNELTITKASWNGEKIKLKRKRYLYLGILRSINNLKQALVDLLNNEEEEINSKIKAKGKKLNKAINEHFSSHYTLKLDEPIPLIILELNKIIRYIESIVPEWKEINVCGTVAGIIDEIIKRKNLYKHTDFHVRYEPHP